MLMEDKSFIQSVKGNIGMLKAYFFLNISAAMEYRTSFLLQVFGMFLNNLSFAFFWWLLFERFQSIGGYGFREVMLLWAFSSAGYGVSFVVFGNSNKLVEIILKGELDSYLLQPKNVLLNVIGSKTNVAAWGDLLYGIILYHIIEGISLKGSLLFVVFTLTAALLYTSVMTTFNASAFYFGNIRALANLAFEFTITLSIYPTDMFKGFIRVALFTIIPAGFITMIPINLVDHFELKSFILLLLAVISWMLIACIVFYKGLKKYESGNLMVQKM